MLNYIITYGLMLFYYSLFFMALNTSVKSGSGKLKDVLEGRGNSDVFFSQLIAGILFLGTGSAVLFKKRELDTEIISFGGNWDNIVWILIATSVILGILSASQRKNHNHSNHSLPSHLPLSFVLIRTLFLIMYEFFFRGVLLFIVIADMGAGLAIILNLIFYVLAHWFDKQERIGSVIMGIVLCGVTIYYHSVWPAIIIHLSLALSYEIGLLIKYKSSFKNSLI